MSNSSFIPLAINEDDLTTPSATKNNTYVLGGVYQFVDSAQPDCVKQFMYVKSHTTLVQYQPYIISFLNTAAGEVVTAAPITQTSPIVQIGVPQVAFTSGYYGFVQIQGQALAKIDAETYAAGDPLELIAAGTTLIVNGTSGTPLVDNKTAAISQATGSTATSIAVYLIGGKVQNALLHKEY